MCRVFRLVKDFVNGIGEADVLLHLRCLKFWKPFCASDMHDLDLVSGEVEQRLVFITKAKIVFGGTLPGICLGIGFEKGAEIGADHDAAVLRILGEVEQGIVGMGKRGVAQAFALHIGLRDAVADELAGDQRVLGGLHVGDVE